MSQRALDVTCWLRPPECLLNMWEVQENISFSLQVKGFLQETVNKGLIEQYLIEIYRDFRPFRL